MKSVTAERVKRQWTWPLNVAKYDRRVSLSKRERHAMLALLRGLRSKQFDRQPRLSMLNRLLEPILDALRITRAEEPTHGTVVRILLREMVRYDSAFWNGRTPSGMECSGRRWWLSPACMEPVGTQGLSSWR